MERLRGARVFATLAAVGAALVSFALPSVASARQESTFQQAPCPFTLPSGFIDGQNVTCGLVTAPTRHDMPGAGVIADEVAVFKSTARHPSGNPILYLGGGPSGTLDRLVPPQVRAFTPTRDVIIVDQRGVEFSRPALNCPDVVAATETDLQTIVSGATMAQDQAAALSVCRDRWQAGGIDLAAFNFGETASDVGDVIAALGYRKVDLYGVSFGTQLSLQAMREFQNRIGAVILNSGYAPDQAPNVPDLGSRIRQEIWDDCAADSACAAAFPDIENVFAQTQQSLNANPISVEYSLGGSTHTALVDGNRFAALMGASPSTPSLVWSVAHGNTSALSAAIPGFMGIGGPNYSVGAHLSMICPYLAPGSVAPASVYGLVCPSWPATPLVSTAKEAISSTIPTLVLNGMLDGLVPVDAGPPLAAELKHGTAVAIPGLTHAFPADANPCVLAVQNDFLDRPSQAPDTSCVSELHVVFPGTA